MLSDKIIEKLVERLVQRIEKLNLYALKEIAKIIKELRTLRPSDTHKLIQIMQYGGDYRKIVKKLAEINKTHEEEIKEIFEEVSKKDYQFAEQFYKYRKKNYIPWEENKALREQTEAIARITANEYNNLSKTLAFSRTVNGKIEYTELSQVYQNVIDEGITSVSQGRSSFDATFRKTIRELSKSGLKSVDWESGVVRRLDTAVRMNLRGGLMHLHEENEKIIGKQIGADGVEITVHENPAPDHEEAQGKQFTNEEFDKLQNEGRAKDVDGEEINLHRFRIRTKDFAESFRPIGEYNCYHRTFSIVLGVNKPLYDKERLKEIRKQNKDGFEYEGDHYTMYQGTQLQRKIETAIRREKDTQIMAKESGDEDLAIESQTKINTLLNKYVDLSNKSGLPTKMERIRVDEYRPIKIDDLTKKEINKQKSEIKVVSKQDLLNKWNEKYKDDNIVVKRILEAEPQLIDEQITQVDSLLNKYTFIKRDINQDSETNALTIQVNTGDIMGERNYARLFGGHYIEFNEKYFKEKDLLVSNVKDRISKKWWQDIDSDKYSIYPVTHEFGHLLEYKMIENIEHAKGFKGSLMREDYSIGDLKIFNEISKQVPDIEKYVSDYGKSTKRFEWFAETFTQMELGKETPVTKALKKYIDEFIGGNYEYFR